MYRHDLFPIFATDLKEAVQYEKEMGVDKVRKWEKFVRQASIIFGTSMVYKIVAP